MTVWYKNHSCLAKPVPSPTLTPTDPVPRGLLTLCPGASSGQGKGPSGTLARSALVLALCWFWLLTLRAVAGKWTIARTRGSYGAKSATTLSRAPGTAFWHRPRASVASSPSSLPRSASLALAPLADHQVCPLAAASAVR